MPEELKDTLTNLLQSNVGSNLALTSLLDDYAKYHAVLVLMGSFLIVGCMLLGAFLWIQFKRTDQERGKRWPFEKKVAAALGLLSVITGLSLTLLVLGNASNVLNPKAGFSLLVETLGRPQGGTEMGQRYAAFNHWLQSGHATMPLLMQGKIQERLAWQQPKAVLCGVLFLAFVVLSVLIWRYLIRQSRRPAWTRQDRGLLVLGVATVNFSLLLMVMFMAKYASRLCSCHLDAALRLSATLSAACPIVPIALSSGTLWANPAGRRLRARAPAGVPSPSTDTPHLDP